MTAEDMFRLADVVERHGDRLTAEGFATLGAHMREDARNLRAQAWEEVTG